MKQQPVTLPTTREAKLMHLYSIIEDVPPEQINVREWTCGTHACIGGWACLDPTFNKMGLGLKGGIPEFESIYFGPALGRFLGLSNGETDLLFYNYHNQRGEKVKKEALSKIKRMMG